MERSTLLTGGLAVAVIVVVPGLAKYALTVAGYNTIGDLVWMLGYGVGAVVLWFRWVRPLEITGPRDRDRPDTPDSREDS